MKKRIPPVISQTLVRNGVFPEPEGFPSLLSYQKRVQFFEENSEFDMYTKFWETIADKEKTEKINFIEKMLATIDFSTDGNMPPTYEVLASVIDFQKELGSVEEAIYKIAIKYHEIDRLERVARSYKRLGLDYLEKLFNGAAPIVEKYCELLADYCAAYGDFEDYGHEEYRSDFFQEMNDFWSNSDLDEEVFYSDDVWKKFDTLLQQPDLFLEAY